MHSRFVNPLSDVCPDESISDHHLEEALERSILIPEGLFKSMAPSSENPKSNPIKKTLTCSYVGVTMGTMGATMSSQRPNKLDIISFVDESM